MKTENKPYNLFCTNCQQQIGENDRELWFDADVPDTILKPFCSIECISEYCGLSTSRLNQFFDSVWKNEDNDENR